MPLEPVANRSDTTLVEKAKIGDHVAFEELVTRYQRRVYGLAYRLTSNTAEAEDVLQEVFLQVYQKINNFRGESAFYSWLYKITLNTTYMRMRKRQRRREEPIEDALPKFGEDGSFTQMVSKFSLSPETEALRAEARRLTAAAIDTLAEEYKTVLILRDIEGLPAAEVGAMLGLSIPAIKSRLHRARLFLRQKLENYFKERKGRTP
ncbi:MAG: sigma-70 family RNA polymerase sigma factor [Acidobacteria bacterium]|nr:sigma-70 family RNA polymerase sigma factor [Acidobacteriota bacterium]MBI3656653.1 sigma-70 family RNA polymerase sigma factor [Acidobacteriota bacterium]